MRNVGKHNGTTKRLPIILITSGIAVAVAVTMTMAVSSVADVEPSRAAAGEPSQNAQDDDPVVARSLAADRASRAGQRGPRPSSPNKSKSSAPKKKTAKPKAKSKKAKKKVIRSGSCEASYYWQGQSTASGERFDPDDLTAAHKALPMGSKVRVTSKQSGKKVIVRINDRGPFIAGRCLDLSRAAMQAIGGTGAGVIPVKYEVLAKG